MNTEKATGRATSATAREISSRVVSPGLACARCRLAFSSTTTVASTTMPTEKASPPRLMRLEVIEVECMTMNVKKNVSGSESTTRNAVRSSARNRNSTKMTQMPPSSVASMTVLMQALIR
ncbi:MAG: hypothetical protein BWY66_02515 [bacterium ADurb.Bin374]|nr:MAG: hypothetical protein BWY66_02515 [bacterium ADurb.Bin374]